MISFALMTFLTAAAPPPGLPPRKAYGACLKRAMNERLADKLAAQAFAAAAKAACAAEEAAFTRSLVDEDLRMKIKRPEAEANAAGQVQDYLANTTNNYRAALGDGPAG